jgi:glutaredoxin 3
VDQSKTGVGPEVDQSKTGVGPDMVRIYGKDSCPYTQAARDDFARRRVPFEYINVKKDPAELERMLTLSAGRRAVPVIVDDTGDVTIGFGGT